MLGIKPNSVTPKDTLRPSDMFYTKIIPALKEKGVTNVMSRKDWPPKVMEQVFKELQMETPRFACSTYFLTIDRTLISKELWGKSLSTLEWWQRTQMFNRSVAVMSVVGYIIGLGDRHLDNILLDTKRGEVVHIDYSILTSTSLCEA
jgi:PI-3-kinase-related kinase SMG-1